jgi:hypothetical protein
MCRAEIPYNSWADRSRCGPWTLSPGMRRRSLSVGGARSTTGNRGTITRGGSDVYS